MTELPYDVTTLAAIVDDFNRTWWFTVIAALLAVFWTMRSLAVAGIKGLDEAGSRYVCYAIAGMSLVVGGPYLAGSLAPFDFMSSVYSILWIVNGFVFLGLGVRGQTRFAIPPKVARQVLGTMVIAGLYPVMFWLEAGMVGLSFAVPGANPDATAIFILALLLAVQRPLPLLAWALPAAWTLPAVLNGYLLGLLTPTLVATTLLIVAIALIRRRKTSD